MPDEQDPELLLRFVQGHQDAFESLFRRFQIEVYHWILRVVRDASAAEDVLVEAFWRAYRGRARFDPSRSFGAWMRRIATNAARDHLRAARSRLDSGVYPEQLPAPANPDRDRAQAEAVALAFKKLPARLQVVALLALVEERPYAEIADALGVPIGTVKSRTFRAIRALRKELTLLGLRP